MTIYPYFLSLLFCLFVVLYLCLAVRIRLLPLPSPTFICYFTIHLQFWVLVLSFLIYLAITFYAYIFITDIALLYMKKMFLEFEIIEQFILKDKLIESLTSYRNHLESVLFDIDISSQKDKFMLEKIKADQLICNKFIDKFKETDLNLSSKTDPWSTKIKTSLDVIPFKENDGIALVGIRKLKKDLL